MVNGSTKVSALGDIAIFTETDDVPLADVFTAIAKLNDKKIIAINGKSTNDEVGEFFAKVLPEFDQERVHISDIKKIAAWYNILIEVGMTEFVAQEDNETDEELAAAEAISAVTKKSASKVTSGKTSAPKANSAKMKSPKSANIRKSQ